jgi:hypothetical protein
VTYGLLNLTHRDSHAAPEPLVPGAPYDVELRLSSAAHRFNAGGRIGLAISESLWPLVWPSPEIATLTLSLGALSLPVRPHEAKPAPFPIPERHTPSRDGAPRPTAVTEPVLPGLYRIELSTPLAAGPPNVTGARLGRGRLEVSELREGDPNSGVWRHRATSSWMRGDWDCAVEAACELRSTADEFQLSESLTAKRGDTVVFETRSESKTKRDLV